MSMFGLSVDSPYPSTEDLGKDRESVRIISPAYADSGSELTAVMQYVFQSVVFSGLQMKQYARILTEIAVAEMHHLDILGDMIYGMGTLPVFTSCPPLRFDFYNTSAVSYASEPVKMIRDDIRGEQEAIRLYQSMVRRLRNEKVSAVISRIILDEQLHLSTLQGILAELEQS